MHKPAFLLIYIILMCVLVQGSCEKAARKEKKDDTISVCGEILQDETGILALHEEAFRLIVSGHYKEAEQDLTEIITLHPEFYGAYRTLGEVLSRYSSTGTITEFLNEQLNKNPENGYACWALGFLSTTRKAYDAAIKYFKQAIELKPEFYDAYENLVDVYNLQGTIKDAAPLLESYFGDLQKGGSGSGDYGLAYLYYRLWEFDNAFIVCNNLVSKPVPRSAGRLYKLTGTLNSIKRRSQVAFNYYECALNDFRNSGDKQGEMAALINLGIACDQLLNYETALEKYEQALPLANTLQDHVNRGRLLMNTGIAYTNLDEYAKSFDYYQQALTHFREMNVPYKEVFIKINNNLGRLYELLSDYSRALDYYGTALQLCREIGLIDEEVKILNNMGDVLKGQMNFDGALVKFNQAFTLVQDKDDSWKKAVILNNMGEIYSETGKYKLAMDSFQKSLEYRRQTGDSRGEGITNKNTGHLFYLKGDYRQALNYYRKALQSAEKESVLHAEITGEMGICYLALKQYDKALNHLKKSIEITELFRNRLTYEKHKTGFMQSKRRIYNAIVKLLYTKGQGGPDRSNKFSAFEYSEKAKARTLLNLLEENRIEIKKGVAPELAARMAEIDREYSSKSTQLREELKKPPGDEDQSLVKSLAKKLKKLENEYEDVLVQATIENPWYEQIIYSKPVSPARIQQNLPDEATLLLSYHLTEKNLFAWGIGKETYHYSRQSIEQKKLKEKILYLHHLLARPSIHHDYLETASELYTLLVKPVLPPGSQYNKLIIVPDGILYYLPFEVLVSSDREEQGTPVYLIRDYSIQYVQSATILLYLLSRENTGRQNRPAGEGMLLAVGDPFFDTDTPHTAFTGLTTNTLFFQADVKPLPFSSMEVREIGKLFPENVILSGQDAQEERIKQSGALDDYTYIHIATHSIISEESPRRSGLVLAQDDDPREDGFLQVQEIFNLETRADLVVLSACKTKLGEYIEGEGIIGLTRAWMYAGASSVVASLWSIQDESTSLFMSDFYRNVKAGMSYTAALRKTRLMLMEQERYRHPYFWAGFVLTGKG